MNRKDVREIDTWVFSDYDHNIKCEGTFNEVTNFRNGSDFTGYVMSKSFYQIYSQTNE